MDCKINACYKLRRLDKNIFRWMRAQIERFEFEFDSRVLFEELKPLLKKSTDDYAKLATILDVLKNGQSVTAPSAA
jgi:hypothetical protein